MYRIAAEPANRSSRLFPRREGYRGSSPVRIGNGAADQLAARSTGEALDSIYFADQRGLHMGHRGWLMVRKLLDWVSDNWTSPRKGSGKTRGGRQPFTYGRVM